MSPLAEYIDVTYFLETATVNARGETRTPDELKGRGRTCVRECICYLGQAKLNAGQNFI